VLLSIAVLRVGERGVSWCATCDLPTDCFGAAGAHMPCIPARDALCAAPFPALNTSLLLFPSAQISRAVQNHQPAHVITRTPKVRYAL
jgi:hypothetical protein